MLEGILLPSNMAAKTTFCLYLVKRLIVTFRCTGNVTTSSFHQFPWSLSENSCLERDHSQFQKSHFGHAISCELTHFKKMVRVWKTKSLLVRLRYDPLMVFWRQNHITLIFINENDVTWPLGANGLFPCGSPSTELSDFRQSALSGNGRECQQTLKNTCQG